MSTDTQTQTPTTQAGDKLLLWYLASHGMPPASLLSELNLNGSQLEQLIREHQVEFADMQRQAATLALLDRRTLGQLILSQYLEHLVMTQNPREVAALLKVAKQLPHWVLPANTADEFTDMGNGAFDNELALIRSKLNAASPPLNRQQRRAQAAHARKANGNGHSGS